MAPKEFIGALVVEAADARTLEVVEIEGFAKDAKAIFTEDELAELHQYLGMERQLGAVIKGTGGLRKIRWSAGGKGKRGGARIIYYYGGDHMPLFLIAIYTKSEKADMTPAEKRAATKLVDALQEEYERPRAPAAVLRSARPHSTRQQ
jgi:mRNA-degrading endonuclease RelE of RelBE toxin-antitoxin system